MKTDKHLYAIFEAKPEWIFELTGLESPGECELISVSLKAIEQGADAVVFPKDPTKKLTVVEFQFRNDPNIYGRIVIEMVLLQQQNQMREVQGIIFFRYPNHDPQTKPWNQVIHSFTLREMLESLENRDSTHPLVAVFRPVLLSNEETLEKKTRNITIRQNLVPCRNWKRKPCWMCLLIDWNNGSRIKAKRRSKKCY